MARKAPSPLTKNQAGGDEGGDGTGSPPLRPDPRHPPIHALVPTNFDEAEEVEDEDDDDRDDDEDDDEEDEPLQRRTSARLARMTDPAPPLVVGPMPGAPFLSRARVSRYTREVCGRFGN